MPELPDIVVYVEALERRILGRSLRAIRLASPFFLRSVDPPPAQAHGRRVTRCRRIGKRIAIALEDELFVVIHLMIAGRLHWKSAAAPITKKTGLAAFDFDEGSLIVTEAGAKKRASLHLVSGTARLDEHDPGGLEVLEASFEAFHASLGIGGHTLKRALTDPHLFSGIGNAYSDEILHRARLSPFRLGTALSEDEARRLYEAARAVLVEWTGRLRKEAGDGFPGKVTAFRSEMAVHGRFGRPCPVCRSPVQKIVYAENESNYCARCQTGGRLLADRALSRLLRTDWPKTLDELERRRDDRAR